MKKNQGFIGIALAVLGGFIGLTLLASAMNLITIPFLKFNKQVEMNRDIVSQTYTVENALYNYHWFKERAEAIKANEKQIQNAEESQAQFRVSAGVRSEWTFEDKSEDARLGAVVLGLKNHYNEIVAEYNARMKEADRSIFSQDLPLFFSLSAY